MKEDKTLESEEKEEEKEVEEGAEIMELAKPDDEGETELETKSEREEV